MAQGAIESCGFTVNSACKKRHMCALINEENCVHIILKLDLSLVYLSHKKLPHHTWTRKEDWPTFYVDVCHEESRLKNVQIRPWYDRARLCSQGTQEAEVGRLMGVKASLGYIVSPRFA